MKRNEKLPGWLTGAIVVGTFGALLILETRKPLRGEKREQKVRRDTRNLLVAGTAAIALSFTEMPVAAKLTKLVERKQFGLLKIVKLPIGVETMLAVLLMDYTFYWWHVLTHKVPFLWRFHLAHHADLEMDASTALRFHFGELTISTAFRAAQISVIGVSPLAFSVWQTFMLPEILLHHSNIALPEKLENFLVKFIVTPKMHDVHHRAVRDKTDSNWSSGFSFWDRLHQTWREDFDLNEEPIGVATYQELAEVTLPQILALPFAPEKDAWQNTIKNQTNKRSPFQTKESYYALSD